MRDLRDLFDSAQVVAAAPETGETGDAKGRITEAFHRVRSVLAAQTRDATMLELARREAHIAIHAAKLSASKARIPAQNGT